MRNPTSAKRAYMGITTHKKTTPLTITLIYISYPITLLTLLTP